MYQPFMPAFSERKSLPARHARQLGAVDGPSAPVPQSWDQNLWDRLTVGQQVRYMYAPDTQKAAIFTAMNSGDVSRAQQLLTAVAMPPDYLDAQLAQLNTEMQMLQKKVADQGVRLTAAESRVAGVAATQSQSSGSEASKGQSGSSMATPLLLAGAAAAAYFFFK